MEKILTITQKQVFPNLADDPTVLYEERQTVKAIVLNLNGEIALVGNKLNSYLQLPGGGINEGESLELGIIRECLEEIACRIEIVSSVGVIDDYRQRDKKHNINHCFIAKVITNDNSLRYTDEEENIGMYTKWLAKATVLKIFKKQKSDLVENKVTFYNTGFNIIRDYQFLEKALEMKII